MVARACRQNAVFPRRWISEICADFVVPLKGPQEAPKRFPRCPHASLRGTGGARGQALGNLLWGCIRRVTKPNTFHI
eukprot:2326182-Pyramimonas_sp.AAC.1